MNFSLCCAARRRCRLWPWPCRSNWPRSRGHARRGGDCSDRAGHLVEEPISAGLVRADGELLYPVGDGIPVLLLDEALPLGAA